jgi:phosphatidate cytidylyltransferase
VLRWRLISAAVILALLLTAMWLDYELIFFKTPGAWLLPVFLTVSFLGTEEVLSLLRAKNHRPIEWIVYAGSLLVPLTAALPVIFQLAKYSAPPNGAIGPSGWPLITVAMLAGLVFVGEMARYTRPGTSIVDAALSIFTIVYVGLLISFWALLRLHDSPDWGMAALFSLLLITKMADTGAFIVGKRFGRHKLTPVLSPGKTWEGAIGGIVTACLTSWAFFHWGAPAIVGSTYVEPPVVATLVYGLLLALVGVVGDLAESLLKRDMERKDSSTWLRGLGGVLDIIDAPLMAGPVAWLCWTLGLVGP